MKQKTRKVTNGSKDITIGNTDKQRLPSQSKDSPQLVGVEGPRLNCSDPMSMLENNSAGGDSIHRALRIMPVGDSITAGYTDNPDWKVPFEFGYRSGLYSRLANSGCPFQFVGTSGEPWNQNHGDPSHGGNYRPNPDLRVLGQDHHEGYGGRDIAYIQSIITDRIDVNNPDVILLQIGINGINASSRMHLSNLVDTIVSYAPTKHLIVAQITPYRAYNTDLFNYNRYIRDTLVPTLSNKGARISTVDLYTMFLTDPADPTSIGAGLHANDLNHPNAILYDKMAQAWFEGIMKLGFRKEYKNV